MSLVLDSSAALAWCFEDEQTPEIMALLDRVVASGAVAPQLWPLEVLNGLLMAERRQRLDAGLRLRMSALLRDLPVVLDQETTAQVWKRTNDMAAQHRLTIYDATYLELAQRRGLPLASLDRAMRDAGTALGIALLGG